MKKQLDELLNKEMTRHEFLATLGLGLASMLGFSSILKFLLEHDSVSIAGGSQKMKSVAGYGSSPYGH